jgi:subtilisin family serine protease
MKRLAIVLVTVSALLCISTQASEVVSASDGPSAKIGGYVPGELLVKYKPSVRAVASDYFRSRWGVATVRTFKRIGVQHLRLPKDMTVEEALEIYQSDPDVEYAEPNYLRYAAATTPNDTFFSNLWGLNNINALEAWDITTGNSNVVVAVLDSGVDYNHPDLAANIWTNQAEITGTPGVDDDSNGKIDDARGWDFVDDDNDPMDSDDHGTHVAGTIAAEGNNSAGITGVVWTAQIMPLRFLDAFGSGTVADAIEAIDYAIDNGAKIINASYGSYTFSPLERDAIATARDAGILFVAAAGNDNWNNDSATKHYPSSYDLANIIAVAATDQSDARASFSNYGVKSVDVAAPATFILSARPDRRTVWSDDFDDGDISNWSTGGSNNYWGVTNEYNRSSPNSLTDFPYSNYVGGTDSYAQTENIDLSSSAGSKLTFWWRGNIPESGGYFSVQASTDGTSWTTLYLKIGNQIGQLWYGTVSSFIETTADLGAYDGSNTFYLRFRFQSDPDLDVGEGWFIDDVEVTAADTSYVNPQGQYYQYFQGTSMATPHVAGLAALIWGLDLGQTYAQVKQRILNGVEVKSGLKGTIMTGGRVNAYNSVRNVPNSPSNLSATAASSSKINLSWSDNSYGEDGFKIERKTDASGIYSQIAVTAANATSYSDTGLDELTTYHYRVNAYFGINSSDFSADKSATTTATTSSSGGGGGGGGCFIATAAFGSPFDGLAN